tara:strand:- start:1418 stop:1726 length:309 start_codon:yes stop_codon:yes gene_type:complete
MLKARLAGKLNIQDLETQINDLIEDVSRRTLKTAKANTPIRSGRARKSWSTDSKGPGQFEVSNSVPYIEQLEQGRSKQAPRGITKPTVKAVTGYISRRQLKR